MSCQQYHPEGNVQRRPRCDYILHRLTFPLLSSPLHQPRSRKPTQCCIIYHIQHATTGSSLLEDNASCRCQFILMRSILGCNMGTYKFRESLSYSRPSRLCKAIVEARLGIRQVSGLLALGTAEHGQTVISPPDDENPEQWQKVARWECAYRIVTVKFLTCRSEQKLFGWPALRTRRSVLISNKNIARFHWIICCSGSRDTKLGRDGWLLINIQHFSPSHLYAYLYVALRDGSGLYLLYWRLVF